MTVYEKQYGFVIKLHDTEYPSGDVIEFLQWGGYKFEQFAKWRWYFDYRVALLRVRYPKNYIYATQFTEELSKKTAQEILQQKIISKKRMVTKVKNALTKAESEWNQLFPITMDDRYTNSKMKLMKLESELQELESLIN